MKQAAGVRSIVVWSLLTLPAAAHHSPAMFDMSRDITLEGTITDFSWRNPHVYIELAVAGPDGATVTRRIARGGPGQAQPRRS
jgi:hypothetical protein